MRVFVSVVILAALCFAAGAAETPRPRPLPDGARAQRDIAYIDGGHARHTLDVFTPATGTNWPLIVWVHGGAWLAGSKDNCPALRFLREGYAVASINYRLSQHAVYPAQIEDCKAAIRWLRANAGRFGYDGARIGVWGSSAGGHLVALLGTTGSTREFDTGSLSNVSSRVQCVVDFFGPSDLTRMAAQALPGSKLDHDGPGSPESKLVGGPIQQTRELAARANPINFISVQTPPFLILHGDADDVVPIGQSEILHAALKKGGVDSTFHVVKGAGHGFKNGAEVDPMVTEFFARHLKPARP